MIQRLVIIALLAACACAFGQQQIVVTLDEQEYVEAVNAFAFDMYKLLARDAGTEENLVFSPLSIAITLSMEGVGARGKTADEIWQALHLREHPELARAVLRDLINRLEAERGENSFPIFTMGNGFFVNEGLEMQPDYGKWFSDSCNGEFQSVNFDSWLGRRSALKKINDWARAKTQRRIPAILNSNDINDLTVAILVNTLFFKDQWALKFCPDSTRDRMFCTLAGDSVHIMMMEQKLNAHILDTTDFQILRIPYKSFKHSLYVFLPRRNSDLPKYEMDLNQPTWNEWTSRMTYPQGDVRLRLPRLHSARREYLKNTLQEMDIKRLFENADLTGMFASGRIFVSNVIHASDIFMDEEGTVATAATAVIHALSMEPGVAAEFFVDRPYLFLITDDASGAILFMGRIVNPAKE